MLTDILNRPIKVGDTVLTNHYGSPTLALTAKVLKVGKSKATVDVPYMQVWDTSPQTTRVQRPPHLLLVIDEQLSHNRKHYPEAYL